MNNRLIDALKCKNSGRPPVWLMRQAGRYMPRYQAIRSSNSLWDMFHNQEIIEQVTMLPIEILDVDAAILFSDILLPLECLNFDVHYPNQGGPFVTPLFEEGFLDQKQIIPPKDQLSFVYKSIKNLVRHLKVPLIGFSGAAFTTATYAIEEKGKHANLALTKKWMYQNPDALHKLLKKLNHVIIEHLKLQVQAGAQVLQIFDSWAGLLSYEEFNEFSLPYLKEAVDQLKTYDVPIIIFARGSCMFADALASIQPSAISLDWMLPVSNIRSKIGSDIALQGNIDPYCLFGEVPLIQKKVKSLMEQMKQDPGFIVNLGHGVLPGTNQDHVKAFVDTVKSYI